MRLLHYNVRIIMKKGKNLKLTKYNDKNRTFFLNNRIGLVPWISSLRLLNRLKLGTLIFVFPSSFWELEDAVCCSGGYNNYKKAVLCLKLKSKSMMLVNHLKIKTRRCMCRLWSKRFHFEILRASVAEEYLALSRMILAAIGEAEDWWWWCNLGRGLTGGASVS